MASAGIAVLTRRPTPLPVASRKESVDDWLDFLCDVALFLPWRNPLRRARDHQKQSDFRLRVLADVETSIAHDRVHCQAQDR